MSGPGEVVRFDTSADRERTGRKPPNPAAGLCPTSLEADLPRVCKGSESGGSARAARGQFMAHSGGELDDVLVCPCLADIPGKLLQGLPVLD